MGTIQKKVKAILAMEWPKKQPKLKPECQVEKIISVLEKFDKKIDIALYLNR